MFHLYGFFIGLAIVAGWSVAERIEPRVSRVAPWVIVFGLAGARVWHVVDTWSYYGHNLSNIVRLWEGGMSIWGGIIGGMVGILIYHYTIKTLDHLENIMGAMVTALPLAQAIGRIGNGMNGEFVNKVWILPWWGMEAVLDLILFGILWGSRASHVSPLHEMTRVFIYLVGYGMIRLVLQPYR